MRKKEIKIDQGVSAHETDSLPEHDRGKDAIFQNVSASASSAAQTPKTPGTANSSHRKSIGKNVETVQVYVLGGQKDNGSRLNSVELFETRLSKFQTGATKEFWVELPGSNLNSARTGCAAVHLLSSENKMEPFPAPESKIMQDYIMVIGGADQSGPTNVCEVLEVGKLFAIRQASSSGSSSFASHHESDVVETQQKVPSKWNFTEGSLRVARKDLSAVHLDGKVYALGGMGKGDELLSSIEIYDVESDSWSLPISSSMLNGRCRFGACAAANSIYVAGGARTFGDSQLQNFERFDPRRGTWEELAPMSYARESMCLVQGPDAFELFAIGGMRNDDAMSIVEKYDMRNDKWMPFAPLSTPRMDHSCIVVGGNMFAIGGSPKLNSVERYNAASDKWVPMDMPLRQARSKFGCVAFLSVGAGV